MCSSLTYHSFKNVWWSHQGPEDLQCDQDCMRSWWWRHHGVCLVCPLAVNIKSCDHFVVSSWTQLWNVISLPSCNSDCYLFSGREHKEEQWCTSPSNLGWDTLWCLHHTISVTLQVLRTLMRSSIVLRSLWFRRNGVLFEVFYSRILLLKVIIIRTNTQH